MDEVTKGSFEMDAYEFHHKNEPRLKEGVRGVSSTGARWESAGQQFVCPLTSILAIKL